MREGAAQGNTTGVAKRINTINRMDLRNLQGYREFEAMYETWKEKEVRYEEYCMEDAEVVLVACGMSAHHQEKAHMHAIRHVPCFLSHNDNLSETT